MRVKLAQPRKRSVASENVRLRHWHRAAAIAWIAEDELTGGDRWFRTQYRTGVISFNLWKANPIFVPERSTPTLHLREIFPPEDLHIGQVVKLLPSEDELFLELAFRYGEEGQCCVDVTRPVRLLPMLWKTVL